MNTRVAYALRDPDATHAVLCDDAFVSAYAAAAKLLGLCLAFSPKQEDSALALAAIRGMNIAQDWPFGGGGHGETALLSQAALLIGQGAEERGEALSQEYQRLFVGPGHLVAPPWGSVYMDRDKVTYGATWVELREWMRACGIESEYGERVPEDQIGRLLVMSSEVVSQRRDALPELLGDHLLPWANRYCDLLAEGAELATYRGLAFLAKATLSDVQDLLGIVPASKRLYR